MRLLRQATVQTRQLRGEETAAERHRWERLRNRRLEGAKFRRRHPLGPYRADFFCKEAALVVEADGAQHRPAPIDQLRRDAFLDACGILVLRLANHEILTETERVLDRIRAAMRERLCFSSVPPLPFGRGEGVRVKSPAFSLPR